MAAAKLLILVCSVAVSLLLTAQQCMSDRSFQPMLTVNMNYRYVTPSRSNLPCNGSKPCLTLEEYANDPATYFVNDTIFYFYPGKHELSTSMELCDIHHLHFQAMNNGIVNITFDELVNITWINCTDISLSSINIYVAENSIHLFLFESTSAVRFSNIAIISNMNRVGCSAILIKDSEANLVNSSFIGISGMYGSALAIYRSNITFSGNSMFRHNQGLVGGAILSDNSSLIFSGSNTFVNNTSFEGPDRAFCSYSNAEDNSPWYSGSGGAIASFCSLLTLSDNSTFIKNSAGLWGGGIITSSLGWGSNCSFLRINGNSTFAQNKAFREGGALYVNSSSLTFEGLVNMINNSATGIMILFIRGKGGAIAIFGSSEVKFMVEQVTFSNNSASCGGALSINEAAALSFVGIDDSQNSTEFIGNSAGSGGAISCSGCALFFNRNMIFTENTANYGGAIAFNNGGLSRPLLTVYTNYTLYFIRNNADSLGGALQVDDLIICNLESPECFFSFETASSNNYSIENPLFVFINNSAGKEGSVLYGGELNKCLIYYPGNDTDCNMHGKQIYSDNAMETFMNKSQIISEVGNVSDISSSTMQVCLCNKHHEPDCRMSALNELQLALFPGQLFNLTVVGLGQGNHPVPSIIIMTDQSPSYLTVTVTLSPATQWINSTCTTVYYRAYNTDAQNYYTRFKLYHDNPCPSLVDGIDVDLSFKSCPPAWFCSLR